MSGQAKQGDTHPEVIILDMAYRLSGDEIEALFADETAQAAGSDHPVAVILDVRQPPDHPAHDTGGSARPMFTRQPRNVALWVLVGGSRLSEVIASVLCRAQIVPMITARSMDEAQAVITREMARLDRHVVV